MREFWVSSGHHLTRRAGNGELEVTDELLLAFLARPELNAPADACSAESELRAALLNSPRRPVSNDEIAKLEDSDARVNWAIMVAFRDRLLEAKTIEGAYLNLIRCGPAGTPPLLINHLVHLILRNALDGCDDPHVLRAGELLFRKQCVSYGTGTPLLADAETIDVLKEAAICSPLDAILGRDAIVNLDILSDTNAWSYWSRSDAFTMVLNIGSDPRARQGLAQVVSTWIEHLLHVDLDVLPIDAIEDGACRNVLGLDAEATRIGHALWNGETLTSGEITRILALFRLTFVDGHERVWKGVPHPIYVLLAATPDDIVHVSPHNLILELSAISRLNSIEQEFEHG
ncbi:DUF6352 family protein (plasmid) [Microvirga terrae]|uniref:DUF6352 family protein n=1 Tax=Microvirga terrae TaxID=2740529 RepID=A0ABY5S297_9HYPH|nr:DUF6352 family protein [Microvirga terrae]UVF22177.1 DUF6352 family protein [Microvirga terrae]